MTVTWNGTTITGPVLIYQDEIIPDNRGDVLATPLDGTLICRHETQAQVGWHFANGQALTTDQNFHFRQRRTGTTETPSVSRLTTNQEDQPLENVIANMDCGPVDWMEFSIVPFLWEFISEEVITLDFRI